MKRRKTSRGQSWRGRRTTRINNIRRTTRIENIKMGRSQSLRGGSHRLLNERTRMIKQTQGKKKAWNQTSLSLCPLLLWGTEEDTSPFKGIVFIEKNIFFILGNLNCFNAHWCYIFCACWVFLVSFATALVKLRIANLINGLAVTDEMKTEEKMSLRRRCISATSNPRNTLTLTVKSIVARDL